MDHKGIIPIPEDHDPETPFEITFDPPFPAIPAMAFAVSAGSPEALRGGATFVVSSWAITENGDEKAVEGASLLITTAGPCQVAWQARESILSFEE